MLNTFRNFILDESGAAAAEYALILAVIGAGIAVAATKLGTAVTTAINNACTEVNSNTPCPTASA